MENLENYPSVKSELISYLLDLISDGILNDSNVDDWHFNAFNRDYYIIGYYNANQWLENHNINAFDAFGIIRDYEENTFGEINFFSIHLNSESTVNMLAYIFGEELLSEFYLCETVEELKIELEKI